MLILDLHSHLTEEDVCGYLAGQWDANSHNLAITNTFPCLIGTVVPPECLFPDSNLVDEIQFVKQ
jgi:hypothetical protein